MNGVEMADKIEQLFKRQFPQGEAVVKYTKSFEPSVSGRCFVVGNKADQPSQLMDNDPLFCTFMIWGFDKTTGESADIVSLEGQAQLYTPPAPGSKFALDKIKLGWRNKKGTPQDILVHLDKFFKNTHAIVKANTDVLVTKFPAKYFASSTTELARTAVKMRGTTNGDKLARKILALYKESNLQDSIMKLLSEKQKGLLKDWHRSIDNSAIGATPFDKDGWEIWFKPTGDKIHIRLTDRKDNFKGGGEYPPEDVSKIVKKLLKF